MSLAGQQLLEISAVGTLAPQKSTSVMPLRAPFPTNQHPSGTAKTRYGGTIDIEQQKNDMVLLMGNSSDMLLTDCKVHENSSNQTVNRAGRLSACKRSRLRMELGSSALHCISKEKNVNSSKLKQCHSPRLPTRHLSYVNRTESRGRQCQCSLSTRQSLF